jgi:hypothetical protein
MQKLIVQYANNQGIQNYFKDHQFTIYQCPILYRQVATKITYDDGSDTYTDSSIKINETLWHKAYVKGCLKEYLDKYGEYNKYLMVKYSKETLRIILKNILPMEIIFEILMFV